MKAIATLEKLLKNNEAETVLRLESTEKGCVQALQRILYTMGFEVELKWDKSSPNGIYDARVVAAVREFGKRNAIESDGNRISNQMARALLSRFNVLDEVRHIHDSVNKDTIPQYLFQKSPHKLAITILQTLLNELGFGKELRWKEFGADGFYGTSTVAAVKAFALKTKMPGHDGTVVTTPLAKAGIAKLESFYGAKWTTSKLLIEEKLEIREAENSGRRGAYVKDGAIEGYFYLYKSGYYTYGKNEPQEFIQKNADALKNEGISASALKVMIAVSQNEGALDAVNTYDNSYMTFGMFQWTIGVSDAAGELPALLKKIRDSNSIVYERYFGQHGIEISDDTGSVTGYLILDGKKLRNGVDKDRLRAIDWVFRFWKAGQDPVVCRVQVAHALSRLGRFYHQDAQKPGGFFIDQLVTSEYGMALLLDHHVNRPGHVKKILELALINSQLAAPATWKTEDEAKFLKEYLRIREFEGFGGNPMTDSKGRAEKVYKWVQKGALSDKRGSFSLT